MKEFITICFSISLILSSLPSSLKAFAIVSINDTRLGNEITIPGGSTWYNGEWWPIYIPEWWTISKYPFDPYSIVHSQTGIMFFYVCGYPLLWFFGIRRRKLIENKGTEIYPNLKCWPLQIGFLIMFIGSLTFEIVENSEIMISEYRLGHGTAEDYRGDSYQNIIGDLFSVQMGYMISWLFLYLSVPWISAIWFVIVDICLIFYMRDDGIFLFFNVFLKNQDVIDWQEEGKILGKFQQMNNISLLNPPSVFLSINDTIIST